MNHNRSRAILPDNLVIAAITHLYIGWGFLRLSSLAVMRLTYNGYMGLLPALLFALPFIWAADGIARRFPGETLTRIFQLVFGKYLGSALSLAASLVVIGLLALATRESQLMVQTYFLPRAPISIISVIYVGIALYLSLNGIKSTVRLAGFMLIPPLIIIYGLQLLGLGNLNMLNIRPILAGSPQRWLLAGFDLLYVFYPVVALFFYLPFLRGPESVKKIGFVSLALTFPLFFLAVFGTIGTFGPALMTKMSWPTVEFFHLIDLPGIVLEQAGLLFIITWYGFVLLGISQGLFGASHELANLCPAIDRRWYNLAAGAVILIVAILPINIITLAGISQHLGHWISIGFLSPFLLAWPVAWLRAKGGKYDENRQD